MSKRPRPLLSLIITEGGQIEAEPGENFTEAHLDLMVEAMIAVRAAMAEQVF